jgi:hypothetical protein
MVSLFIHDMYRHGSPDEVLFNSEYIHLVYSIFFDEPWHRGSTKFWS